MLQRSSSFLIIFIIIFLAGCTPILPTANPTTTPTIDSMTFMARYKPQANLPFVGVYVAQAK